MSTPFSFPPPPPPPPKPSNVSQPSGPAPQGQFQNQNWRGRGGRGGVPAGRNGRGPFRGRGNARGHHQPGFMRGGFSNTNDTRSSRGSYGMLGHSPAQAGSYGGGHSSNPTAYKAALQTPHQNFSSPKPPREKKPKVPTAPPTPAFGAPLPSFGSSVSGTPETVPGAISEPAKKKRRTNQLGLTPMGEDVSDEEADEEAKYAALGQQLVFEYNGTVSKLNSANDIEAWIAERKRKWPTKARVEAKRQEAEATARAAREKMLAEKRALVAQSQSHHSAAKQESTKKKHRDGTRDDDQTKRDKRITKLEQELERLKAQTTQAKEASVEKAARLLTPDEEEGKVKHKVLPKDQQQVGANQKTIGGLQGYDTSSSSELSSETSDEESSAVSSDDNDPVSAEEVSDMESAPEEQPSSKPEDPPRVAAPPRTQNTKANDWKNVEVLKGACIHFYRFGRCSRGRACRYKHIKREEPRKSLYQRLVEQEKDAENHLALQAIKTLGQQGFFSVLQS